MHYLCLTVYMEKALRCKLQPSQYSVWIKRCPFIKKIMTLFPLTSAYPISLQFKILLTEKTKVILCPLFLFR